VTSAGRGPAPRRKGDVQVTRPLLFEACPGLKGKVDWMPLGEYPTPVAKLSGLCAAEGISGLYVKRDDLSSPYYGGNKVRKLEFILPRAKRRGHDTVITYGAVGSNHVVATVIHGERVGIKTIALLPPQPNAAYVRKNLLLDYAHGAEFAIAGAMSGIPAAFARGMASGFEARRLKFPYVIPPGGSYLWGSLGYVDAALELKEQVDAGQLPEPEFIFATYGSGSTAAGLIAGVQLAGLASRVVSVRVVDKPFCNRWILGYHVNRAVRFIGRHCPGAPVRSVDPREITLIDDFAGPTYARFTPEGLEAVRKARECDGIKLDGTYTGKTLAAALDFIKRNGLEGRPCLFWNTLSSVDLYPSVRDIDYHDLPAGLHRYFTEPLQEEEFGCDIVY
jgi:D-cysteine desulfhydrase